jgi:hypothetical protein
MRTGEDIARGPRLEEVENGSLSLLINNSPQAEWMMCCPIGMDTWGEIVLIFQSLNL